MLFILTDYQGLYVLVRYSIIYVRISGGIFVAKQHIIYYIFKKIYQKKYLKKKYPFTATHYEN